MPSQNITAAFLNGKRKIMDEPADKVIATIIEKGSEKKINELFTRLVSNDSYNSNTFNDFPPAEKEILDEYFQSTSQLPTWADPVKIKKGQQVFSYSGPEIFMLLNVKSLPLCYTCAKGAKVLAKTGRLLQHNQDIDPLARRLMETGQMVMNTMSPGAFQPDSKGIVTIQKVRLVHASIRYFMKNKKFNKDGWDSAKLGEPINQEDLAGTLLSFGPVILNGLEKLNIKLTPNQKQGYLHCWKIIGHLIGLDEDLLTDNYQDAQELTVAILKHQSAPSEEGKALTASCLSFLKYMIPGNLFDHVAEYMMWYFMEDLSKQVGKDLSKTIGVSGKADLKDKAVVLLARLVSGKVDDLEHHGVINKVAPLFYKALLNGFMKHYNGGKQIQFYIPPSLQKNWKLQEDWIDHKAIVPDILGNRLMWQRKQGII